MATLVSGEEEAGPVSGRVGPVESFSTSCVTCRVSFSMPDQQREHHKSDWHRYNLKRRMAELPPISADLFKAKLLLQQKETEAPKETEGSRCEACSKSFQSKAALDNHVASKKHKENAAKNPERSISQANSVAESEEVADVSDNDSEWSEGDDGLGLEECLFCPEVSDDLESSLTHMSSAHSFFVPDLQYCVDLAGFKLYLGQKVGEGFMCLWCNESGKRFGSLDGVRKHMRDKGHCRLAHDEGAWVEYADFFDFSASYPDGDEADPSAPAELPVLEERDWQLVLPSGATLGHRDLRRYFRQRALPENSSLLLSGQPNQRMRPQDKLLGHYKALGWTGCTGKAAVQKARDVVFLQRIRNRRYLKLGIAGNKNLQHHFRYQVNFAG